MKRLLKTWGISALAFFGAVPALAQEQFKLDNPLGNTKTFKDVIDLVTSNLLTIAIPIAVLLYIWAGIQFMISRGNPAGITNAKNIMTYTSIGLAIILIGSGFVSLIQSILNLG